MATHREFIIPTNNEFIPSIELFMLRAMRNVRFPIKKKQTPFGTLVQVKHLKSDETQCSVCLDRSSNIHTTCSHTFCEPCMRQWYYACTQKCFTCPVCRTPLHVLYKQYESVDMQSLD